MFAFISYTKNNKSTVIRHQSSVIKTILTT